MDFLKLAMPYLLTAVIAGISSFMAVSNSVTELAINQHNMMAKLVILDEVQKDVSDIRGDIKLLAWRTTKLEGSLRSGE